MKEKGKYPQLTTKRERRNPGETAILPRIANLTLLSIANSKPNVRFDTEKFSDVLVA